MPTINVRWADNTSELKARLKEGIGAIDAMKASVEKTVQAMGGQGLFKAANNVTAAIIQMGGATKLTAAEQQRANVLLDKAIEKYKVMGQVVPPAMQKIADATRKAADATGFMEQHAVGATDFMKKYAVAAEPAVVSTGKFAGVMGLASGALGALGIGLSVGAVVSFGKSILADADALTKMHDKTGISVEGLQKFQLVADEAGNTIEQLTVATNQMQNRLAGNDKSAVAAVEHLGLSLSQLKALSPEQQFMTIADAIRQIKDPAEQVNVAMDLFGRQGAEILPTIKRGFDDVKDSAVGMSAEAVKGLDDFGDAMTRWERAGKAHVGEFLAFALPGLERAARLLAMQAGILPTQPFGPEPGLPTLPKAPSRTMAAGAADLTLSTTAEANAERILNEQLREQIDTRKKATEATEKALDVQKKFLQSVHDATDKLTGGTLALHKWIDAIPGANSGTGQLADSMLSLDSAVGYTTKDIEYLQRSGRFMAATFVTLKDRIVSVMPPMKDGFHEAIDDLDKVHKGDGTWLTDLGDLTQAFSQLAQISGSTFGGILQDVGKLIGGFNLAATTFDKFSKAEEHYAKTGKDAAAVWTTGISAYLGYATLAFAVAKTLNTSLGLQTPGDVIKQEMQRVQPLDALIAQFGTLDRVFEQTDMSAEEFAATLRTLVNPRTPLKEYNDALARLTASLDRVKAAIAAQPQAIRDSASALNAYAATGIDTAGKFKMIGEEAVTVFAGIVRDTGDVVGALEAIGPTLDALAAGEKDLGVAGSAAVQELLGLRKVVQEQKPLMDNIATSTALLKTMAAAGLLNATNITAFGQNAVNQFTLLKQATGSETQAMVLMQPELQALWEHEQKFGKFADDATQSLVDQAETNGIVGEDMKSVDKQILDILKEIAKALGADIPGAAEKARQGILDNLGDLNPQVNVDINTHHHDDGLGGGGGGNDGGGGGGRGGGNYARFGGLVTPFGIQRLSTGGIVHGLPAPQYLAPGGMVGMQTLFEPRGTDTVPAMLTPGEHVLTAEQWNGDVGEKSAVLAALQQNTTVLRSIDDAVRAARSTSVQIDGREIVHATNRVLDNGGAVRTDMREALGVR